MKKILIAVMAVLATVALNSCVQEKSFKDIKLGDYEVVFKFKGAAATKAAGVEFPSKKGLSFRLAQEGSSTLVLEETITDLNALSPATKGTPAYTENVGVLYADNLGVYAVGFGDATYENMGDAIRDNGGWRYHHNYPKTNWDNGWASGDDIPVYFYLRMPADMTDGHGVTLSTTGYDGGAISFTYTSPSTAEAQRDILFASRQIAKSELDDFLPEGAPVLFHHALTGVKFRIDNDSEDIENKGIVKISHVAFIGLQDSGKCKVTPKKEAQPAGEGEEQGEGDYIDIPSVYSSGDGSTVVWSDRAITPKYRIEQDYDADGFVDFEKGDGNNFPDSFYEGGATQNVNAEDASLTFWLVPQVFSAANGTNEAVLEIQYVVEGDDVTKVIQLNLGEVLAAKNVEWKPGELRTYSLHIDEVNVKIDDTVSLTNSDEFKNSKKENILITNTGDTDVYIRAAIVGQWLDEYGNPVFGFSDFTHGEVVLVESWYQDQFGTNPSKSHGKFTNLVGYDMTNGFSETIKWKKIGKYYYFADPVEPGQIIGTAPEDASEEEAENYLGYPLFTSYEVLDAPDVTVALAKKSIWFELEIAVQAVSANKTDGTHYSLTEAWARAGVSAQ